MQFLLTSHKITDRLFEDISNVTLKKFEETEMFETELVSEMKHTLRPIPFPSISWGFRGNQTKLFFCRVASWLDNRCTDFGQTFMLEVLVYLRIHSRRPGDLIHNS
jgi:hypothetical protein